MDSILWGEKLNDDYRKHRMIRLFERQGLRWAKFISIITCPYFSPQQMIVTGNEPAQRCYGRCGLDATHTIHISDVLDPDEDWWGCACTACHREFTESIGLLETPDVPHTEPSSQYSYLEAGEAMLAVSVCLDHEHVSPMINQCHWCRVFGVNRFVASCIVEGMEITSAYGECCREKVLGAARHVHKVIVQRATYRSWALRALQLSSDIVWCLDMMLANVLADDGAFVWAVNDYKESIQ